MCNGVSYPNKHEACTTRDRSIFFFFFPYKTSTNLCMYWSEQLNFSLVNLLNCVELLNFVELLSIYSTLYYVCAFNQSLDIL